MTTILGFYRGRQSKSLGSRFLAWWQRHDCSHVVVVKALGTFDMRVADATLLHGVRANRWTKFDPSLWVFYLVPADASMVHGWFAANDGAKYDLFGLLGFVLKRIRGSPRAWWCTEAVAQAAAYPDPWRWDVAFMDVHARLVGRRLDADAVKAILWAVR